MRCAATTSSNGSRVWTVPRRRPAAKCSVSSVTSAAACFGAAARQQREGREGAEVGETPHRDVVELTGRHAVGHDPAERCEQLALMQDRAFELGESVRTVVGRNKGLMVALGAEVASMPKPHDGPAREHPVYQSWHGHVTALLRRRARPWTPS